MDRRPLPGFPECLKPMRPLTFINGVILGSAASLGGAIGVILFFRWVMTLDPTLDQTVVQANLQFGTLLTDMLLFLALTALAALAFWGELRERRWRAVADLALAAGLAAVFIWFFADAATRARDLLLLALAAVATAAALSVAWRLGLTAKFAHWLG